MADRETPNDYQKECILAAWRIQTGLTDNDYYTLRAKYMAKTQKDTFVFNFMWFNHSKINRKIEDLGTIMSKLCFDTLEDMQRAWMRIELRLTNFERIYGLPYKSSLQRMLNEDPPPTTP
jgi:hypothetical protein